MCAALAPPMPLPLTASLWPPPKDKHTVVSPILLASAAVRMGHHVHAMENATPTNRMAGFRSVSMVNLPSKFHYTKRHPA
jgi:hypothetical protein